jgi:hypothetical protein
MYIYRLMRMGKSIVYDENVHMTSVVLEYLWLPWQIGITVASVIKHSYSRNQMKTECLL